MPEQKSTLPAHVCRRCSKDNPLDQWFELPNTRYLVCPTCAAKNEYARSIHINTVADRLLEAYELLTQLKKANDELTRMHQDSPDIAKQLRRVNRSMEKGAENLGLVAAAMTELMENLSPRWVFAVDSDEEKKALGQLLHTLSERAGPGAILQVSSEQFALLSKLTKL